MNELDVVNKALELWGLTGARYSLAAARENKVYKVETSSAVFALRLHRKGYRTDPELWSELQWMDAVSNGGINVPKPIRSSRGQFMHSISDIQVDLLTWLSGQPMDQLQDVQLLPDLFQDLGKQMARLHNVSDQWMPPNEFTRCHWNRKGLLGDNPLWGRFWENPGLNAQQREVFTRLRVRLNQHLAEIEDGLDYGLIHADLVAANVIFEREKTKFIDFDDSGYGFRLFDIATALMKHIEKPFYSDLKAKLLKGYGSVRSIGLAELDLFILLRALTYVGWNISRIDEKGAGERNTRFIAEAYKLALDYSNQPEIRP